MRERSLPMKNGNLWLPLCLFALVLGLLAAGHLHTKSTGRLTDAAVLQYRLSYPVCTAAPDARAPTPAEIQGKAYSFVYGQILGELSAVVTNGEHGEPAGDARYAFQVIQDTKALFPPEDVLHIAVDSTLLGDFTHFREGMLLVLPLPADSAASGTDLRLCQPLWGMFYVTNSGYVLSIYDESAYSSANGEHANLSGLPVAALLERLK